MFHLFKNLLYSMDPEKIHELTLDFCQKGKAIPGFQKTMRSLFAFEDHRLQVHIGNLCFPNPVCLAAGFDKDAIAIDIMQSLGFGAIEVGTVTPKPQPGNPKPRLFRLKEDKAIINHMGFNNIGIDKLIDHLKKASRKVPIGINIGKNKSTPLDRAVDDYLSGIEKAWNHADYITLNVSSPNTPELRKLQVKEQLEGLLRAIGEKKTQLAEKTHLQKQIWLKIDPDLDERELKSIVDLALDFQVDALIVANTSLNRSCLKNQYTHLSGGLSGKPIFNLSNEVLRKIYLYSEGKIPLVGVGGIFNAEDCLQKIMRGASLVQLYTGLIFEGPMVVKHIKKGLKTKLEHEGLGNIKEKLGVLV
ncbi:MAG: quinone-dependent dihydroorotate dehydrogenase [Deltaproteobacteria bacterium]|nr:quinone-dependent dihydroorotate dehydrogenase [Deltaproteobacteria bacterium]